ncbi:MAG TPA: multiheme c-type cytochrome, partial [Gemmataceae bacterium]|nr:multiheme c-type cytochrome [Gemmataceae bacterium]
EEAPRPPDDPRIAFKTPYLNVRPDVRYVGDEACARCHAAIAKKFRQHPMGRSLAPVAQSGVTVRTKFTQQGLTYRIEQHGARLVHGESLLDAKGEVLTHVEEPVAYILGSGTRGRSYLINRDGFLFQSPISWYTQERKWALSPNYAERNQHFERPINSECLSCHSNYADAVENTINRFREPIFRGYAIGCERCHGPGELHVELHQANPKWEGGDDYTIVNPRKLDRSERESVCQQCHLQGQTRILRAGRGQFDFRPGLPLHLFWSVFVPPPDAGNRKAVSQVEQMYASRCFRASKGTRLEMGCISCHDPHEEPAVDQRISYYRDRCLSCHEKKACSLPLAQRREKSKEDSCIACHMPRIGNTDIAHTALTDHRILRREIADIGLVALPARGTPLVHFHADLVPANDPDVARDFGIALTEFAVNNNQLQYGPAALSRLDPAVKRWPKDLPALNAYAFALGMCNRKKEGLAAFEEVLRLAPDREATLVDAAGLTGYYLDRPDPDLSHKYWQRAIGVNPYNSRYHYELARLDAGAKNWESARDACLAALRLNPASADAQQLLVTCYRRLGDSRKAQAHFQILLSLRPNDGDQLRRWFDAESR